MVVDLNSDIGLTSWGLFLSCDLLDNRWQMLPRSLSKLHRHFTILPLLTDWGWCESYVKYWSLCVGFLYMLVVDHHLVLHRLIIDVWRKITLLLFVVSVVKGMDGCWLLRCHKKLSALSRSRMVTCFQILDLQCADCIAYSSNNFVSRLVITTETGLPMAHHHFVDYK